MLIQINKEVESGEKWTDVLNYEGMYRISSFGRLWSLKNNRMMNPTKMMNGYISCSLCNNGVKKHLLHRLVLRSFLHDSNMEINHIDGKPINNNLHNLEYCTSKENTAHAIKTGLFAQNGELNKMHKLTEKQVKEIRIKLNKGITTIQLSKEYNVSRSAISMIKNNKRWSHI